MRDKLRFVKRKAFELFVFFPIMVFGFIMVLAFEFFDMDPEKWPKLNKFMDRLITWAEGAWYSMK
jgi:hypothetical protein